MRADVAAEIARAGQAAIDALETSMGNVSVLEFALRDHETRMQAIYTKHLFSIGMTFGGQQLEDVKAASIAFETKRADDDFEVELTRFIRAHTAQRVVQVSDTTRRQIRTAVRRALESETPGVSEMAKRIRETTKGRIAKTRSLVIARTEMHAASVAAQDLAVEASGVPFIRQWLAALDDRTRGKIGVKGGGDKTSHRTTDGHKAAMKEAFLVDRLDGAPDKMMRPGDPKGPADQVVNCRCAVIYIDAQIADNEADDTQISFTSAAGDKFDFSFSDAAQADRLLKEHFGMRLAAPMQLTDTIKQTIAQTLASAEKIGDTLLEAQKRGHNLGKGVTLVNKTPPAGANGYGSTLDKGREITINPQLTTVDGLAFQEAGFRESLAGTKMHASTWTRNQAESKLNHTVRHEIGHTLTNWKDVEIADKLRAWMESEVPGAFTGLDFTMFTWSANNPKKVQQVISEALSTYAAKMPHETVAEAFAWFTSPNYIKGSMPAALEEIAELLLERARNLV